MVTLNINIEGDGKSTTNAVSTGGQIQQDMPSPQLQSSIEGASSAVPSPESFDTSFDAGLSLESVPHPEESGISTSVHSSEPPGPELDSADQVHTDTGVPMPSDTEESGAKPATKRKPRATKTKPSGK